MDLLNTYMRSRGDYSPSLLKRTGTGGVRGNAGLADAPFHEYLANDELPHYVFASADSPDITVDGEPLDHHDGGFATLFAATSDRLICVAGGPDGDETVEIAYEDLTRLDAETGRRGLTKQTTITAESENVELAFHTKDHNAVPAARTFVDERVADAHLTRARQQHEAGTRHREAGDAEAAQATLADASAAANRAVEWAPAGSATMSDGLDALEAIDDEPIEPPETDDDPDHGADAEPEDAPGAEPTATSSTDPEAATDARTTLESSEPLARAGDYDDIPSQGSVSGAIDALAESRVEPLEVTPTEERTDTPRAKPASGSIDRSSTPASDLADPSGTVAGETARADVSATDATTPSASTVSEEPAEPTGDTTVAAPSADAIPEQYRTSYEAIRDAYHSHAQFQRAKIGGDVEEAQAHLQDARDAYETYLDELAVAPIEEDVDDLPGDSRALPSAETVSQALTKLPEIPPQADVSQKVSAAGTTSDVPLTKSTDELTSDAVDELAEANASEATVAEDDATPEPEANENTAETPEPVVDPAAESSELDRVKTELAAVHAEKGDVLEETDLVDADVTVADCIEAYGSWTEAVEAAGCEPRPRLLGELQRITFGLGEIPTREQMNAHGRYDATLYDRYFDSWEAAKSELDAWTPETTEEPSANPEPQSLDARLTAALRELHAEKGYVPTRSDVMNDCPHSILRFNREFGSLDEALEAAGIAEE